MVATFHHDDTVSCFLRIFSDQFTGIKFGKKVNRVSKSSFQIEFAYHSLDLFYKTIAKNVKLNRIFFKVHTSAFQIRISNRIL